MIASNNQQTHHKSPVKATCLLCILAWLSLVALPSFGHLHYWKDAETTKGYLRLLFPTANDFLHKQSKLSSEAIAEIEKILNARLYPEDKNPAFFFPIDSQDQPFGLAMFVAFRLPPDHFVLAPKMFVLGIAVRLDGKINNVVFLSSVSNAELTKPQFLNQFKGKTVSDPFHVGQHTNDIKPVPGQETISQMVALNVHKTLLLMNSVLGKRKKR